MKLFYLLPACWLFGLLSREPDAGNKKNDGGNIKWVVQKTSNLSIKGHTNVNSFSCAVNQYTTADTITLSNDRNPYSIALSGKLVINVGSFDCRNRVMTDEFKKVVKQPLYPQLKIEFINLEQVPGLQPNAWKGRVNIELAGVCKQFELAYTLSEKNGTFAELMGCTTICFSDFGLRPPKKAGGIIRVRNELEVQFHLYFQQIM